MALTTSTTLLGALGEPGNDDAWERFASLYRCLLLRFVHHRGFQFADADEIVQEVTISVVGSLRGGAYNRSKGRFRQWLFTVVKNHIAKHTRRKKQEGLDSPDANHIVVSEHVVDPHDELQELWDEEERRVFLDCCMELVRGRFGPQSAEIFERIKLGGEPVADVAHDLGVTHDTVYSTVSRILKALQALKRVLDLQL